MFAGVFDNASEFDTHDRSGLGWNGVSSLTLTDVHSIQTKRFYLCSIEVNSRLTLTRTWPSAALVMVHSRVYLLERVYRFGH
jgi:hypothetical protein